MGGRVLAYQKPVQLRSTDYAYYYRVHFELVTRQIRSVTFLKLHLVFAQLGLFQLFGVDLALDLIPARIRYLPAQDLLGKARMIKNSKSTLTNKSFVLTSTWPAKFDPIAYASALHMIHLRTSQRSTWRRFINTGSF